MRPLLRLPGWSLRMHTRGEPWQGNTDPGMGGSDFKIFCGVRRSGFQVDVENSLLFGVRGPGGLGLELRACRLVGIEDDTLTKFTAWLRVPFSPNLEHPNPQVNHAV